MNRRNFIKTGLIFVPTYLSGKKLIAQDLSPTSSISTRGLLGHWKMDYLVDSTKVWDASASANHGTLQGGMGAPTTDAHRGRALSFDGINDFVQCGSGVGFSKTTAASVSVWLKNTSGAGTLLAGLDLSISAGWELLLISGNVYFGYIDATNTTGYLVNTTATVNSSTWRHVVVTYDGSSDANGIKFYIDGTTAAKTVVLNVDPGTLSNTAVKIGERGTVSYLFTGSMDEALIYNRELLASDVNILYHQ